MKSKQIFDELARVDTVNKECSKNTLKQQKKT